MKISNLLYECVSELLRTTPKIILNFNIQGVEPICHLYTLSLPPENIKGCIGNRWLKRYKSKDEAERKNPCFSAIMHFVFESKIKPSEQW